MWAGPGPVEVVEGFLTALHQRRYHDAWSFLDSGSQSYIVDEVARTYSLEKSDVKKLFDTNDPQTTAFWDAFRTNAKTDSFYSKCEYWLVGNEGETATVGCRYPGSQQKLDLYAVKRDGRWGFDYFTTFASE